MAPGPLVLGLILGPMLEGNARRALLISRGDPTIFLTSPISLGMLVLTVVFIVILSARYSQCRRMKTTPGRIRQSLL